MPDPYMDGPNLVCDVRQPHAVLRNETEWVRGAIDISMDPVTRAFERVEMDGADQVVTTTLLHATGAVTVARMGLDAWLEIAQEWAMGDDEDGAWED